LFKRAIDIGYQLMEAKLKRDKRFNDLFKRAIDIGYQLMEAKLNQENCRWLSGEIVLEKKPLRLGFESL
jgi:hypothetical protein